MAQPAAPMSPVLPVLPVLPVVWAIAGHDTSGGAGLSADQRAADALGTHLCPVVACITAQHSQGVDAVFAVPADQLEAQLQALAQDLPPQAIKTGLLGHVDAVMAVARWVDQLRTRHPELPLIIDPVLGASAGGSAFSNDAVLQAYREHLLPRATLITPNRAEARRLLGLSATHAGPDDELPTLAAQLRKLGAQAVVITGGDAAHADHSGWVFDWLDTPHAQGWLCAPRVATPHHHGTGCTFASAAASAMALGHVAADAVVLAKMVTRQALVNAHAAGQGSGPVKARAAHATQPFGPTPYLGIGTALPWQLTHGDGSGKPLFLPFEAPADGLYGILPNSQQLQWAAQAGVRCLQLRHKARAGVEAHIMAAAEACAAHGATFFVNDHWDLALDLLTPAAHGHTAPESPSVAAASTPGHLKLGLHLGQEDLLALPPAAQARLLQARHQVRLGLSSHSLWELARAAGCGASLIACGPVQATTTKDMPWQPQGERNLHWWVAHSPAPVVAIGGLLTPADLRRFAACGPATLCVVRGLGATAGEMGASLPLLREAVASGRREGVQPASPTAPALPSHVL